MVMILILMMINIIDRDFDDDDDQDQRVSLSLGKDDTWMRPSALPSPLGVLLPLLSSSSSSFASSSVSVQNRKLTISDRNIRRSPAAQIHF